MNERRTLARVAARLFRFGIPVPSAIRPIIRALYHAGVLVAEGLRWIYACTIVSPTVRSIAEVGQRLRIEQMPYIRGSGRLVIGNDVQISGKIGVLLSRHGGGNAQVLIGDSAFMGHQVSLAAAREIRIGSHCLIATGVRIQDNDGHPLDAEMRKAGKPVAADDIKPVKIGDGAWIGQRATILKGVTIGENAVIGAGSVVIKDIPPDTLAAGVPAKVIRELAE